MNSFAVPLNSVVWR